MALFMLTGLVGCQEDRPTATEVSPGTYEVMTRSGVALEVLDWGGAGRPLIFLGGVGATAHVFDDFAPLLTDDFRVLGITRRGLGGSSDVVLEEFADLLEDIVDVLDALELSSVVLVGHSFAGFEMTRFAERYGGRCLGLIYLDSAYDYAVRDVARVYEQAPPPEAPPMLPTDSASVESVRAWYQRTQGFTVPASEVRRTGRFDSNGRYLGRVPMTETARRVASLERPAVDLDALDCPSLGLFPVPGPLGLWHPSYQLWTDEERRQADAWHEAYLAWVQETRDNFDQYPLNEMVEFPNTGHGFFLQEPEPVLAAIREFALGVDGVTPSGG